MTRYLRIRAEDGTPLCEVTDEGTTLASFMVDEDLYVVINSLADHVRQFHEATKGSTSQLAAENQRLRDIAGRLATTVAWVADGKGAEEGMQERAAADMEEWNGVRLNG